MSAEERLTAYLCSNPGNEHMDGEYAAFAARLLRQHAHELAEKIRNHDWAAHTVGERCCDDLTAEAADLIDPEVE